MSTLLSKFCLTCEKEFITNTGQEFCSRQCKLNFRVLKQCPCGKEFIAHSNKEIFCSDECKDKYLRIKVKNCLYCNKEFTTRSHNKLYCSQTCRLLQKKNNPPHISNVCQQCGKLFMSSFPKKYCSEECLNTATSLRLLLKRSYKKDQVEQKFSFSCPYASGRLFERTFALKEQILCMYEPLLV